MYFGEKILRIRHDYDDSRIMFVFVQVKPLPSCLEWNDKHITINNTLSIGSSHFNTIGMNLETHPHAFIAGETGSGKSNILKCFIYQALKKNYDVVLIDFKRGVSFSAFSDKITIYYEYPEVVQVLNAMVEETKRRLDRFRETGVDNIADYNNLHANAHSSGKSQGYMSRKIVFIDELAELLKTRDKEISNALNDSIETLTRLARAVGIHLIMGIQRPDSTIVSGQIKNNVSFRICGRFVDKEPRRIMLGTDTASSLPNVKGRFIVKDDGIHEAQAFYFHDGKYKANNRNNTVNSHKHKDEVVNIAQQAIRQAQERQEASAIYATQAPQPLYEQGLTTQGEADGYIEDQPPVLAIQGESSGKQVEVPKDSEEEAPKDTEAETIHFDFSSFGK
ncbi:MAG: FtsK/SpoIIIE domain-containing protein [Defluviitaleaceae bacterium]|nr:FtsK/SpoIIIE domain-containing protein [Defluviitaleaceae bacterium]MCL2263381.1 FtsK/SpoIIIE domain-containing protein [Defluviitaleaceae bacterium]